MTKRRTSSPYRQPPSALMRGLTQRGWRRCDAEALVLVKFCLEHATDDDLLPLLASRAAAALAKEPVLAGAVMLFGQQDAVTEAAFRLWQTAGEDCWSLALLCSTAGFNASVRALAQSRSTRAAECN